MPSFERVLSWSANRAPARPHRSGPRIAAASGDARRPRALQLNHPANRIDMDNTTTPTTSTNPSTTSASTPFPTDSAKPTPPTTPSNAPAATSDDAKAAAPIVDGLIKRVTQSAHDAVDSVAAKVSSVSEGLQGGVDKASDTRDEWIASARDVIREHPFAAVAGALVIGAALLSLRSSRD
jgi:ElaB/YqjD/DUF883 family membrane-anchored ribosome-binding protein